MGDHGLWNRGDCSFDGKYPKFCSLDALTRNRSMRWNSAVHASPPPVLLPGLGNGKKPLPCPGLRAAGCAALCPAGGAGAPQPAAAAGVPPGAWAGLGKRPWEGWRWGCCGEGASSGGALLGPTAHGVEGCGEDPSPAGDENHGADPCRREKALSGHLLRAPALGTMSCTDGAVHPCCDGHSPGSTPGSVSSALMMAAHGMLWAGGR